MSLACLDPLVVVINGPAGVGKTTVGRLLAARARNGVCIHGDDLKGYVVARERGSVSTGLSYVGAAALADVFIDGGYELIVIDFVFSRAAHVDRFRVALRNRVPIWLFTLWAPLEIVQRREANRPGRARLGQRVSDGWNDMAAHRAELGIAVDATSAPAAIVAEVGQHLDMQ